jgi:peroxiredoxin
MSLSGILRFAVKGMFGGARMLKVGEVAPAFEGVDQNGTVIRSGDLRGRKIVLWFYPKADTPG